MARFFPYNAREPLLVDVTQNDADGDSTDTLLEVDGTVLTENWHSKSDPSLTMKGQTWNAQLLFQIQTTCKYSTTSTNSHPKYTSANHTLQIQMKMHQTYTLRLTIFPVPRHLRILIMMLLNGSIFSMVQCQLSK